jgi:hypothetical protein
MKFCHFAAHVAALALVGLWMVWLTFLLALRKATVSQISLVPHPNGWRRYAIPFELIAQSHRVHR